MPSSPFSIGTNPHSVVYSPNGLHLATANPNSSNVSILTIDCSSSTDTNADQNLAIIVGTTVAGGVIIGGAMATLAIGCIICIFLKYGRKDPVPDIERHTYKEQA